MYPPAGTKFVRFTLFCKKTSLDNALEIFNMRYPYNCDFRDLHFDNVRCVGMVPSGFNNLVVTGCSWEGSGWAAGRSAFDSEDGWDGSQHLVFKNNTFGTNPNAEFNGICGHNFIVENNTMKITTGARLASVVVRNNTLKTATFNFGPFDRSAYPRIYGNTIQGWTNLNSSYGESEMDREYLIRDNLSQGGMYVTGSSKALQRLMYAWSCTFTGGNVNGRAVNCTLTNVNTTSAQAQANGKWYELEGCLVTSSTMKSGSGTESVIKNSTISDSQFVTGASSLVVLSSTMTNSSLRTTSWTFDTMHIEGNTFATSGTNVVFVPNSFGSIGFYNNIVNSSNSTFHALDLRNPNVSSGTMPHADMRATVCGNTFNAVGGYALKINTLPTYDVTVFLGLSGNTCSGLTLASVGASPKIAYVTPPSVELTTPTSGSAGSAPVSLTFSALASDADGIARVEFYEGEKFLGDDSSAPYSLSLSGFEAGSHAFTARAIDNGNTMNVSPRAVVIISP